MIDNINRGIFWDVHLSYLQSAPILYQTRWGVEKPYINIESKAFLYLDTCMVVHNYILTCLKEMPRSGTLWNSYEARNKSNPYSPKPYTPNNTQSQIILNTTWRHCNDDALLGNEMDNVCAPIVSLPGCFSFKEHVGGREIISRRRNPWGSYPGVWELNDPPGFITPSSFLFDTKWRNIHRFLGFRRWKWMIKMKLEMLSPKAQCSHYCKREAERFIYHPAWT